MDTLNEELGKVISNWNIIERVYNDKTLYFLTGTLGADEEYIYPIRTSYIKNIDIVNGIVKTRNSTYYLREKRDMFTLDMFGIDSLCDKINEEMKGFEETK